jgi:hypothetical protein
MTKREGLPSLGRLDRPFSRRKKCPNLAALIQYGMHIGKKGVVWLPISVFTAYLGYKTPFLIRPVPKGPEIRSSGHNMDLIRQIMRYIMTVLYMSCSSL